MQGSPFRYRGVTVVVDTAQSAEFDIRYYSVPGDTVTRIGDAVLRLPQAATDRAVGPFLIREIEAFDVVWMIGREGRDAVITIYRIRPPDPADPTERILQSLNLAAMLRGATGV